MGAVPGDLVLRYSTNGEEGCKGWKEVILDVILVVNLILEIVVFFLL